jgi:hypothetical protein
MGNGQTIYEISTNEYWPTYYLLLISTVLQMDTHPLVTAPTQNNHISGWQVLTFVFAPFLTHRFSV